MIADSRNRFLIETCDVRGQFVHLDACWKDARARTDYPDPVAKVLGESFAATALLAGTIKFDGKVTFQVRGSGDVYLLVVQITNKGDMRGLARWNAVPESTKPADIFGDDARLTITIEKDEHSEPYQGIVPLEGESLASAIEHYFVTSEQLNTKLMLSVSDRAVSGLLLQTLPSPERQADDADGWDRSTVLAETLTDKELLEVDPEVLLHRLYHEEQVRIYESSQIRFECTCSRERTDGLLISLGETEVQSIVAEQGKVTIDCEFCDANYQYDSVDVTALFKGYVGGEDTSTTEH